MTFKELFEDKDFLLSTNVERALYRLLVGAGISEEQVVSEKYDEIVGEIKEDLYRYYTQRFDKKYKWDGYYKIIE